MREIKFKAKTCNGEWVEGLLAHKDDKWYISNKAGMPFAYEVRPENISQYIGLKDRNGKEIYEGDIVEFLDVDMVGQVVYENGCFGIGFKDYIDWNFIEECIEEITGCNNILRACLNDNFISLWEIMWNYNDEENSIYTVKVIGNIFDNPELLDADKQASKYADNDVMKPAT